MVVRHSHQWPCIHLQHSVDFDEDTKGLWPWSYIFPNVKQEASEGASGGSEEVIGDLSVNSKTEMGRVSSLFWGWRGKSFVLQKLGSSAAIPPEFSQCILSKVIQVLSVCYSYNLGSKSLMKTSLSFEEIQVLVYHTYFTAGSNFYICSKLVSLMYMSYKSIYLGSRVLLSSVDW